MRSRRASRTTPTAATAAAVAAAQPQGGCEVDRDAGVVLLGRLVLVAGQLGLAARLGARRRSRSMKKYGLVTRNASAATGRHDRPAERAGPQPRRGSAVARERQRQRERRPGEQEARPVYLKPIASPRRGRPRRTLDPRGLGNPHGEPAAPAPPARAFDVGHRTRENATGRNAKQRTRPDEPVRRSQSFRPNEVHRRDAGEARSSAGTSRRARVEDPSAVSRAVALDRFPRRETAASRSRIEQVQQVCGRGTGSGSSRGWRRGTPRGPLA